MVRTWNAERGMANVSRETMSRTALLDSRSSSTRSASRLNLSASPVPPSPFRPPRGITLVEILISMFVLLFGLMGVAAIFPVASHYVVEGEKKDRGSGLAQIAFEELKARGILQPKYWMYASPVAGGPTGPRALDLIVRVPSLTPQKTIDYFNMPLPGQAPIGDVNYPFGPGHAFVIDPLGSAENTALTNIDAFPIFPETDPAPNPWLNTPPPVTIAGTRFPVRRLTLPASVGPLAGNTAETIFRLRDDLAVEQPDAGDRPSIQRWSTADVDPATGNPNNTPNNFGDDTMLARDYVGDYTWLATVVPTRQSALLGLAPASRLYDEFYEVSAVVFYKRDTVPSATIPGSPGSERLIAGEFLNSGELAIYSPSTEVNAGAAEVDAALDKIKPGNWVAVMGVNQVTGVFMMKWYKILALDDETGTRTSELLNLPGVGNKAGRYAMVQGPDWPTSSYGNLRVAILPGAIDVYTRVMRVNVE